MSTPTRFRVSQGELFSPPAKLPQLPIEAHQRMVRLLARMMNEHLETHSGVTRQAEVDDE